MGFALFFLGEYSNMIMISAFTAICFFGGWYSLLPFGLGILPGPLWLGIKVVMILFGFIWVRAAFPRYRFDQLMYLGWYDRVYCYMSSTSIMFIFTCNDWFLWWRMERS
jgi:NADH-quinone oxidoreductase subunit H